MILALHHAQITIPKGFDSEARQFYCGLLGLKEVEKPENLKARGGFWLELSNLQVHVGVQDGVDRKQSNSHVAYLVDNIDRYRDLLRGRGIEVQEGLPIPGYDRFECRDPFGNRLEFIQRI